MANVADVAEAPVYFLVCIVQLSDPDCKSGEWCDSTNANGLRQTVEDLLWAFIGLGKVWLQYHALSL